MSPHRRRRAAPCRLPRGGMAARIWISPGGQTRAVGRGAVLQLQQPQACGRSSVARAWGRGAQNVGAWARAACARAACARTFPTPNTPWASLVPAGWRLFQAWVERGSQVWGADPAEAFRRGGCSAGSSVEGGLCPGWGWGWGWWQRHGGKYIPGKSLSWEPGLHGRGIGRSRLRATRRLRGDPSASRMMGDFMHPMLPLGKTGLVLASGTPREA